MVGMRAGGRIAALLAGVAALTLGTAACSSTGGGDATSTPTSTGSQAGDRSGVPGSQGSVPDRIVQVLASTNVWGDVVLEVGGNRVAVTSLMSDPSADPHSYQATAQNQLAVSKAALIVANGGGYDDFVDTMSKAANVKAPVIHAVDLLTNKPAAGEELNEHVWYDFPTVVAVADSVRDKLSAIDPAGAADYASNAKAFADKVAGLEKKEADIKAKSAGVPVSITEPVPLYLLEASGLVNKTPKEFSEGIEEGTDVSAAVLADTLKLYSDKQVKALVYNEQTSGPETEKVLAAAKAADIAVVPVTETLPQGKNFISWMTDQLDAVAAAVA